MPPKPKPPRLALVCASIHTGASRGLWTGLVDEALVRGARVLVIPGGRLGAEEAWESSRNLNYRLASPRNADGIVSWTTSLSGSVEAEVVEAFVASLSTLPLVTVSQAAAGAPLVAFDAYRGMRSMVEHLIDVHGHRTIAFIRGPSSHVSAQQRFRAYRDVLEARGLAYRPELVTPALAWDAGSLAPAVLLDEGGLVPGRDFAALVAASDLLAFWAMEGFLSRGWRIPEDLALGGFNDSLESSLASPALSTVGVDFEREGGVAADILLRLLAGETVPKETLLPAELRLRRSCGCPTVLPETRLEALPAGVPSSGIPAAGPGRRALLATMAALLGTEPRKSGVWLEALLDSLVREGEGRVEGSPFLGALELALDRTSPEGLEPGGWQPLLSLLRALALAKKPALSLGHRLEDVFHRARSLAFEASRRALTRTQWLAEQRALELRRAGAALLLCHDLESLVASLGESLARLGIPRAWLALSEDGAEEGAGKLRLVAALGTGPGGGLPPGGLVFEAEEVLPPGFLPEKGAFVVEPLFFRDEGLGRLILEIGPRDGGIYEELRSYLSSALRSARLFGQAEEARRRAEAADLVKTRLMASVSRGLCEPLARIVLEARAQGQEGIGREAEGQLALIEDLLDLSRADLGDLALDLGLVDPRALLLEALAGRGTELSPGGLELAERLPLMVGDRARLLRILTGLLEPSNPPPKSGLSPVPNSRLSARLEANLILVEGQGFAGASRDLSSARRILGLLGARLEAEGEGFRLSLPLPPALGRADGSRRAGRDFPLGRDLPDPEEVVPGELGLLVLDLEAGGDWEVLASLRGRPELASLPLAVFPPPGLARPAARALRGGDFLDFLEAAWPEAAAPPVFILASRGGAHSELRTLAAASLPGRRLLCLEAKDLASGRSLPRPALILAESEAAEAWLALSPGLAPGGQVPLLVLGPELCPRTSLLGRPRILVLPWDVLAPEGLVALIRGLAEGRLSLSPGPALQVQKAQVWLARGYGEPLTRSDMALALGINGDYLGRLFHGLLGLSPWEYLGRLRVRAAQDLLEAGSLSLAEIAGQVGLPDQAYFSRVFRKFAGKGPREWKLG